MKLTEISNRAYDRIHRSDLAPYHLAKQLEFEIKEYAKLKCREQREICGELYSEYYNKEVCYICEQNIKTAPEPEFD